VCRCITAWMALARRWPRSVEMAGQPSGFIAARPQNRQAISIEPVESRLLAPEDTVQVEEEKLNSHTRLAGTPWVDEIFRARVDS
jgi:hypothetical protein